MGVMVVVGYTAALQGDTTDPGCGYLRECSGTEGLKGDKGSWYLRTAELQ